VLALGSLVVRFRAAGAVERRQVGWFGYALAVAVLAAFVAPPPLVHLTAVGVPVALLVAVVRYRLYDIDALVRRTAVAVLLLGGALAVYAAVVGWAAALLGGDGGGRASFAGAVAVACCSPRRSGGCVGRSTGCSTATAPTPTGCSPTSRRGCGGRRRPTRRWWTSWRRWPPGCGCPGWRSSSSCPTGGACGSRSAGWTSGPARSSWSGRAARRPAHRSAAHRRGVARRARRAPAGRPRRAGRGLGSALALSSDLARSREQAVSAREEERRRVRRDLHDGLGPQLAGVALLLESAGNAVGTDDDRARRLLALAREQAEEAVVDVRRLVHGLRPPALDDLGLVGALRAAAPEGAPEVEVLAQGELADLPAAVEVAAYRIVQESLLNARKHAGAARAVVRLSADDDALLVEVSDDGCGIAPGAAGGVGLSSMRERAAELGGTCSVVALPEGGSRVTARLPRQRSSG
jgi:signal transduction histidine kinase